MTSVLTFTCYALIFCLFVLSDYCLSPYYGYFSSERLLSTTSWLVPRVLQLHFICLFIWISGAIFSCLGVTFQYHSRLVAFYVQTSFHLAMKWSAIVTSFISPRYLYIYFLVPLCWVMADWTYVVARIESKLHPRVGYRSFLVRVSKPMRIVYACLGFAAAIRHIFFK
jgi:hypothetical protein